MCKSGEIFSIFPLLIGSLSAPVIQKHLDGNTVRSHLDQSTKYVVKLPTVGCKYNLFLLAATVNSMFLSEMRGPSHCAVVDDLWVTRGRSPWHTVHCAQTSRCIILSVEFNAEQIRQHLTELVLYDWSLYSHRRLTAAVSQASTAAPE